MFKIEVEDGNGIWSDVSSPDGTLLTFEKEDDARAKLAELSLAATDIADAVKSLRRSAKAHAQ